MDPRLSLSFGGLIDGLFNRVDKTVNNAVQEAKNALIEAEIETGRELELALDQVKNFYRDQLDYTLDKVNKAAVDAFNRLDTLVQSFEKDIDRKLEEIAANAQQLINSLPFASKQPQLTSVKPRFIVINDLASLVVFKGNFPWSAKPGFEPSLTFAGKKCAFVDSSTQSLAFKVPHSAFENDPAEKYSFTTGTLQVPWDEGVLWSSKTEYDYKVGLGALPKLAGKGYVEYVSHSKVRDTQGHSSDHIPINGNEWNKKETWHRDKVYIRPSSGWLIDVSKTPQLRIKHEHGKHNQHISSVSSEQIVVDYEVYADKGKDIGIFYLWVDFEQYQERTEEHRALRTFQSGLGRHPIARAWTRRRNWESRFYRL